MRRRIGTSCVWLAAVFLCEAGLAPGRASAQMTEAQTLAVSARAQALADQALARNATATFAQAIAGAAADIRAALEASRGAAETAAADALTAAAFALDIANAAAAIPAANRAQPASLALAANAEAAAHSAEAAAQRADSAVATAYAAYFREQTRAATTSTAAGAAAAATAAATAATARANQAEASLNQALAHDVQIANWVLSLANLGAQPDLRYTQAAALNKLAEAQHALAVQQARLVPSPTIPPPPTPGRYFQVDGNAPNQFKLTYNLDTERTVPVVFNGTHDGAKLALVTTAAAGPIRPARIGVTLTFTHGRSGGTFTIPRTPPLRLIPDQNGKYTFAAGDLNTVARDFIRIIGEIDRTISVDKGIDPKDVTITIQDDNGQDIDTIRGSLNIIPRLVNARH